MEEQLNFNFKLTPALEETGSVRELNGVLPLEHFYKGYQLFKLEEGVSYDIELSNTGGGVLLRGLAHAIGTTECARCLEEAAFDVESAVEGFFILDPTEQEIEQSDDEMTAVPPDGVVDLMPPILAAIIYELPLVILCNQECAGLCQNCGANLNFENCECALKPDPGHPFAILKDLLSQN